MTILDKTKHNCYTNNDCSVYHKISVLKGPACIGLGVTKGEWWVGREGHSGLLQSREGTKHFQGLAGWQVGRVVNRGGREAGWDGRVAGWVGRVAGKGGRVVSQGGREAGWDGRKCYL